MTCILTVRVTPRSKKRSCGYDKMGRISIHLRSAPEQGAANEELIQYVADLLDIARSRVKLVSGLTSRIKRLEIDSAMSFDEVYRKLGLEVALQSSLTVDRVQACKKKPQH